MLNKRTNFVVCLLAIILLLSTLPVLADIAPPENAAAVKHITLTWSDDPKTTQTITWKTDSNINEGQVEYVEALETKKLIRHIKNVSANSETVLTNLGDINIHSVTLTGLKSGTRYLYRVGDGILWSELHSFTTAPASDSAFKFLVFGDSQSINYDVWHDTLHQAFQANPDAAFFVNVGDLVDVGQDYSQWKAWFNAAQGIIDTIPIMPVVGNHETYTPERKFSLPVFFTSQFKLPSNGPDGLNGQVYSFDYGDAHFIILDSQAGEEKSYIPDMIEKQKNWLENDLAGTNKKWKLVFVHRPPYNNKASGGENIRRAFTKIFDKYHIDVVFTAHEHVYARTYPLYGDEAVDSHAKGTVYVATGRSGTKTYTDTFSREWNEFFINPVAEPNYITVIIRGNVLTVNAFTQSGSVIDSWNINKSN